MRYKDFIEQIDGRVRRQLISLTEKAREATANIALKKNNVGVDLGACAIKCAEVYYDKDKKQEGESKAKLLKAAVAPLGRDASFEDTVEAVKEVLAQAGIRTHFLNIAVGGEGVVARNIYIPQMTKEELHKAVKFEAYKYIPFPIEEVVLDFSILPEPPAEGRMHVLLVAAKKALIDRQLRIIREAGYECALIDINGIAATNTFLLTHQVDRKHETIALIDVGAASSNLNIIVGDIPYFVRDMMVGGNDMTSALVNALDISFDEAEALKCDAMRSRDDDVRQALNPVFEDFCEELQRCFDYFGNQSMHPLQKIIVTGGASRLKIFLSYLQTAFPIDIITWDPLEHIGIDYGLSSKGIHGLEHLLATSIGLGLRR
ncbi:MAG: type IV pilus assembly protein PilM [Candidatus Omnitrophica bacterium]|nr:type IV pilus assembly protein PilM [Candidatus Omnitrophota bacterium]